jgi:hypothetical protein
MAQICHVTGCGKPASSATWVPSLGCCIVLCKAHKDTPAQDRVDWLIDFGRALQEHCEALDRKLADKVADVIRLRTRSKNP